VTWQQTIFLFAAIFGSAAWLRSATVSGHNWIHRDLWRWTQQIHDHIRAKEVRMNAQLEALQAAVTSMTNRVEAGITLLNGLGEYLLENATDPAAIQQMAETLTTEADALQAAIDANTPPA
jgi:hypothetical protein